MILMGGTLTLPRIPLTQPRIVQIQPNKPISPFVLRQLCRIKY